MYTKKIKEREREKLQRNCKLTVVMRWVALLKHATHVNKTDIVNISAVC